MWAQIVGALVVLVITTYVIQFFIPRSARSNARRASARWDIAPLLGFFGALLLALSLTEALRRAVIEAWAWGSALGLVASVVFWIALGYRENVTQPRSESALRATFRIVRTYGTLVLVIVLGVYLAARVFGAVVEVFVAGAIGILIVAMAVRIFVRARQITRTGDNDGKPVSIAGRIRSSRR
jgi:hypothetical protein